MSRTIPPAKGRLRAIVPAGATLAFQYDPEQLRFVPGVGSWARVPRPRQVEAVEWTGIPATELTLTLWFDRYADRASVEPELAQLFAWGLPAHDGSEPPVLQLLYAGLLNYRWVLNGLSVLSELTRSDGQRTQAQVSITLLEHVGLSDGPTAGDSVRRNPFTPTFGQSTVTVAKARTYVVKAGDTLQKIAARTLGKASRWKDIASLNGLRDPATKLKVGRTLKLPAS